MQKYAFPRLRSFGDNGQTGMELQDWFAGQALPAAIAVVYKDCAVCTEDERALAAVKIAKKIAYYMTKDANG
jgi:hypothetical protein